MKNKSNNLNKSNKLHTKIGTKSNTKNKNMINMKNTQKKRNIKNNGDLYGGANELDDFCTKNEKTVICDIIEKKELGIFLNEPQSGENKCAPLKNYENGSCISLDLLLEMAIAYNKSVENNADKKPILLDCTVHILAPSLYKQYLLSKFNRIFSRCKTQRCWVEQEIFKQIDKKKFWDLTQNTFRPDGPQGKFEWLNTLDINKVMKQYEHKNKEFKFLGAVPIDAADMGYYGFTYEHIHDLYKEGKYKIGVIYNLDRHDQSGSHWVALYGDLKKNEIYFSDSVGSSPKPEISAYMKILAKCCCGINKKKSIDDITIKYNKQRHQQGNSECGVYSLNFIIRLLKGESFDDITKDRLTDSDVNTCRTVYFYNAPKDINPPKNNNNCT